ncbi:MAG: zeta toxin family protein [Novosphingobium sp.]|nr:zeta toxin family protein [Novosphingobium sp.]
MNKELFLRRFNVEKHIIGTEAFEMNQDIMKGVDQEEILEKARSGFYKDTAENRKLGRVGQSYGFSNKLDKASYNTTDRYFRNNKWNIKRVKDVHYGILNDTFRGIKPAKGTPTCVIVMGGTASGKGTVTKPILEEIMNSVGEKFAHLDVDDFKKKIPEYNKFKRLGAANNVHEESSHLGKRARKFAISNKLNFVNDGTFSNMDKSLDMIKSLKNKGYNIKLINVSTDIDEAKIREKARFKRSGRKVGEDILEKSHIESVDVYNKIKDLVDEYSMYDNNVGKDEKAILVDSHKTGIVNEKLYKKFQDKRNYKPKAYKKK